MARFVRGLVPVIAVFIVVFLYSNAAFPGSRIEDADQDEVEPHHIVKRSTVAAPAENTFDLVKITAITEMKVGSHVYLVLTITFKAGTSDMVVELFAPDNDKDVMILCNPKVVSSGKLTVTSGNLTPTMEAKTAGSVLYDRAIFTFVVDNTVCDTVADCQMRIEWGAILIDNAAAAEGNYWVSAGAEYQNAEKIWVGQTSLATLHDKTVPDVPEYNVTGPSEMAVGSSAIFEFEIYLPNPSVDVKVDVFTPMNTSSVMTICSATMKSKGSNFDCGYDDTQLTTTMYPATTGVGNYMAELNIGKLLNGGARDVPTVRDNSLVVVQYTVHVYDDTSNHDITFDTGVAVELDAIQIWTTLPPINIIPKIDSSSMPSVLMTLTPDTDSNAEIGIPKYIVLNIKIPFETTSTYVLMVLSPLNGDNPVFQICAVVLVSAGKNLPCIQMYRTAVYSSRTAADEYADTAVLDLGGVSNVPIEASSVAADSIKVGITITPLVYATGPNYDLAVSLTYAGARVDQVAHTFTMSGTSSPPEPVAPTFTMSFGIGTDNVEVGLATRIVLDIDLVRNNTYSPAAIEFIGASGNFSTKISVCRSKILYVGANLPCVTPKWLNKKVTYTSKFNTTTYNRAVHSVGTMCDLQFSTAAEGDKIVAVVDVKMENHEDVSHLTKLWLSAGATYSASKIWVGQLAVYANRAGVVIPATPPYINVIKNTTLSETPVWYPMVYSIIIKVAKGESIDLKVDVESTTDGLYVCGLRILAAGDNFPCLDQTIEPSFTTWPSGDNKKASLNGSYITNIGTDPLVLNDFFDDNSILLEVITSLSRTAIVGSSYSFTASVTYSTSGLTKDLTQTITATDNTSIVDTNVTQSPTFDFSLRDIGNSDTATLVMGEAKRFVMCMDMPEGITSKVVVKFFTPVLNSSFMEICGAAIIEVGKNFPCLRKTEINPVYEKRTGSSYNDIVTLDLGYLCSSAMTSDVPSNRICVEAVAKLLHNSTLSNGDTLRFHGTVNINDFEIFVSDIELTKTDTFVPKYANVITTNETALYVNTTDDVIPLKVGVVTTLYVVINIPPMSSSEVKFDVDFFANNSVIANVKDIRLVGTGTNIACLYVDEAMDQIFTPVFNASTGKCEVPVALVNFGVVSNPGLSHRKETYQEDGDDNSLHLEVDIQLTDFDLAENNAEFILSFGAKFTDKIQVYSKKIVVVRDNTEIPELEFTAALNITLTTQTNIFVDIVMNHTVNSTGKARNASMHIYLPPYLAFTGVPQHTMPPIAIDKFPGFINFGDFLLCDIVEFQVALETNNSVEVPIDILPENTIVFLMAGTYAIPRSGSNYPADYYSVTELQYLNFSAKVTQDDTCYEDLGMRIGTIKDCQLASSIESDPPAIHGRYQGNSFWGPFCRGPQHAIYRYFQVYFGNKTLVAKIIIERGNKVTNIHYPTRLRLDYSDDNSAYRSAEVIDLEHKLNSSDEVTIATGRPTTARYIRIYILADSSAGLAKPRIGLKFEFFGCFRSSDVMADNICNLVAKQQPAEPEFHFRSMAVTNSQVHVCDVNLKKRGMQTTCSRSHDGETWTRLPETVGCLLGYDSTTRRLYAKDQSQRVIISSTDDFNFTIWNPVSKDTFFDARDKSHGQRNENFVAALPIPWQCNDKLDSVEPHPDFQLGKWGGDIMTGATSGAGDTHSSGTPDLTFGFYEANSDGISMKSNLDVWSRKLEWTQCCNPTP